MMQRKRFLLGLAAWAGLTYSASAQSGRVPDSVYQMVVAVADGWNSPTARLLPFSRQAPGAPWQPAWAAAKPVNLGKNGLAWGNGALPVPHGQPGVPSKREKDLRAPAGLFRIGTVYSERPETIPGLRIPAYRVTGRDCWIDDPTRPDYNRHLTVDPANPPPWYGKQRMRLGDFAYEFLLEIRHNSDPPVAGQGSAIFFHIRRGIKTPSHGCTTMARPDLLNLLRWLDARANPHYVLLPRAAYQEFQNRWGLPPMP